MSDSSKKFVIVDYEVGNIRSVENALKQVSDFDVVVSSDPDEIRSATCLLLPGVGAFGDSMMALNKSELIPVLEEVVLKEKKPLLAICVGMQILFERSDEGNCEGLGWLEGEVIHFDVSSDLSIPHFGWNNISVLNTEWLFENMVHDKNFYFAHSFHANGMGDHVVATCDYGKTFPAVVKKDNIIACQFHPEKSHTLGLQLIKNFVQKVNDGGLDAQK